MLLKYLTLIILSVITFLSPSYCLGSNQTQILNLDTSKFLSNPFVSDIVQDSDGFLWFATQNGLSKYDGKTTHTYFFEVNDNNSISSDWINSLFIDSIGRLWATSPKGLHLYNAATDDFINFNLTDYKDLPLISVKESQSEEIWGGYTDGEFFYLPFNSLTPVSIKVERDHFETNKVVDFIFIDNDLLFLTEDGNLWELNKDSGDTKLISEKQTKGERGFNKMTIGPDRNIWLISESTGLFQVNLANGKRSSVSACGNITFDLHFDNNNIGWVATHSGVCSFELEGNQFKQLETIPFSSPVNTLFEDNSQNLWAGTYNGVFFWKATEKSFQTYNSNNVSSLPNDNILSFITDSQRNLYLSSWGGGLFKYKQIDKSLKNSVVIEVEEFKDKNVSALMLNDDDNLLVGTFTNGLYEYDVKSNNALRIIDTRGQAISALAKNIDGFIVASAVGQGVYILPKNSFSKLNSTKLLGNLVFSLQFDEDLYLWSSSYDLGISFIKVDDLDSITNSTKANTLITPFDIQSTSILVSKKYIWAGTKDHGLLRIEKESVYHSDKPELKFYNKRDGLASDFIYGILEDDYGNIWFSHDKGISRLDPTTDKVINFNETHGLQGTDFNSSAYYKDKHGRLYFGGANGFNAFTPDEVPINRHKPPLRLTKFSESNEEMPIHSKLREDGYLELKHNETILDFEFAALDFTRPQDNQYQYMMEGLTDKWVSLGTNNHLSFSHLPVGDYTLRVKGSNNDGVWSDELTIPIEVLPPIWRTWYAYLFYLTLVIGAIILLIIQQREKLRAQLANEQRLHKLAYYDSLTGLPNRQSFYETLDKFLSLAKREHYRAGIVFIDLDRFKRINDTLGHDYGDKVLKEVAFRLQESVRESDMVVTSAEINQFDTELARLGGDEFTLFLSRLDSADEATMITQRIIDAVSEPIKLDEYEVSVTPSVGIAIYPENGETVSELMKHADIAMYQAKAEGRRTFKFYSDSLNEKALERLKLETELKGAIAAGQFELHYQPQVDIHNNQISKAEALVRWHHPELGMVSPAVFIPMAEESGLIIELGDWILEQACKDAKMWQEQLPNPCRVSVNVSSIQFKQSALVDKIENVLASTGLPANLLEIELTESAIMSDVEDNILRLQQIKNMGVAIACDDFGTGYSSLSYLKRFPLDTLKIDRSFIQDVTTDENDLVIVKAVMLLADTMNLKVVAEGVESIEQLEILHKYQCEYIQGYYFAKPLPLDDFILFVTKEFYEDKFMWELELLNSAPRLNS